MRFALAALVVAGCAASPPVPAAPPQPAFDVEAVEGLGLFQDEAPEATALVAQALRARGLPVADPAQTQRAWALAAEGRNPLTGEACGRPLDPYTARRRWGRALGLGGVATSHVWCESDGGCELSVSASGLEQHGPPELRLEAQVSRTGPAIESLRAAIPALAPPPPPSGVGGLGLLGSAGAVREVDELDLSLSTADVRSRRRATDEEERAAFPFLTVEQVNTCLGSDDGVTVLAQFDAQGALTRCEGRASTERAEAACACGQLQRGRAAPWLANDRWLVSLRLRRKDVRSADGRLVVSAYWNTYLETYSAPNVKHPLRRAKVEDRSIEAWTPGSERLATSCFLQAFPQPGQLRSRWAVWFDGEGRATKVAEQKAWPPLPREVADCVARLLRTAQSPCPSRAGLWAMADLTASARDPAQPTGLKGLLKN